MIAEEAKKRGFGEIRVDSITPHIILIIEAGDEQALAEFGAFASATAGTGIHAKLLASYPAWRRRAMWEGAAKLIPATERQKG